MIDHLHFMQVYLRFMHTHPDFIWYERILKAVDKRLLDLGFCDKKYHIAKHYLLSSLEIHLSVRDSLYSQMEKFTENPPPFSEDEHNKITEYTRSFCIAQLFAIASYNCLDTKVLAETYANLIHDDSLLGIPDMVRFRLVDCCFAIEFNNGPLLIYRELLQLGIISCAKYSAKDDCSIHDDDSDVSDMLIRAGLIFELKIMRERALHFLNKKNKRELSLVDLAPSMTRIEKKHAADYYKKLIDDFFFGNEDITGILFRCSDAIGKKEVEILLNNICRFTIHKRMFTGTQASWLGTLGAYYVAIERSCNEKRAIYCEADNQGTITDCVVKKFKQLGFTISARSLYLRHKNIKKDNYKKIRYYCKMVTNMQMIFPWHNDMNLYDMAVDFCLLNKKSDT